MVARRAIPTLLASAISVTVVSAAGAETHWDRAPKEIPPHPFLYQGPAYVLPETDAPRKRRLPVAPSPRQVSLECSFTRSCASGADCSPRTISAVVTGQEIPAHRQPGVHYRLNVAVGDVVFTATAADLDGLLSLSQRHEEKVHLMTMTPQGAIYTVHSSAPLSAEHYTGVCAQ